MSTQYTCEHCGKTFKQKVDFTRHKNKKAPCISMSEIQQRTQNSEIRTDQKSALINAFKGCLNILRDNEGLTGEKALRTMSYLLMLKLIEPHFGNAIDIDNYEYDFSNYEDYLIESHREKLLRMVRFSNISNENEVNIPVIMKCLWDEILAIHPSTRHIFLSGKGFDIQHTSTYKKLINKINELDLSNTEYDVLGNAYEEVIQDIMTGKVLGQFFTQPLVKNMMVKLINPQIHPDGTIETCGDPTMGTGGFLITYLKYILQQAKTKGITPDWNFIKTEGLYGKELEPDTFQLAVSNMLISSGHMFENLDRGDSIRVPITRKFDNILANPPFGIKGLKYDDFQSPLKSEYVPIKTDNAVSLFIQAIIYMLKIGGKCAVVLPDGQDLFSKTNKTLVSIREYLLKTCDLKEVIYLPSGIFTHTSIKTCVFYFIKKREGTDVLETKIKVSKTQKEIGREYKFSKTHQTHTVKFYDYNPYTEVKNLLAEVPIERLAGNSYSLNYAEYLKEENEEPEEEQYEDGVIVKTLGEIGTFLSKSKQQASNGEKSGRYPFYTSSQICTKYCDSYDYEDECLIIGTGGNANIKYSSKFSCSTDNFIIKIKEGQLIKYVYYYLLINIELLQNGFIGVGLQHISKQYVTNIKIPIPSLERQQQIVSYLDFIYETANKSSMAKIAELKHLNMLCLNNQQELGMNVVKKLSELCEFIKTGKNKPSDNKTGTLYPYYGTGSITGYTDEYLYDGYYILTARNGTIGNCFLTEGKFFPSDHIFVIDIKDKCLMKYVYYILSNNEKLDKLKTGVGIPNITKGTLENLRIPIPSLSRQREIVAYCEHNENLIKQLEQEMKNNKLQAKQFLSQVLQMPMVESEEVSETSSEYNHEDSEPETTSTNSEPVMEETESDHDAEPEPENINLVITEVPVVQSETAEEPTPRTKSKKSKKTKMVIDDDDCDYL
jgi:type I restriction-modification system DNA methylase subunit